MFFFLPKERCVPKLTKATEAQRISQAIHALKLTSDGLSTTEACEKAGISRSQYYRWIKKGEKTIESIRNLTNEVQRVQIAEILASQVSATRQLIADALADKTSVADRIKAYKILNQRFEELTRVHNAAGHAEDDALKYLQGPTLKKGKSRFSASRMNNDQREDDAVDVATFSRN
jgi:transposase